MKTQHKVTPYSHFHWHRKVPLRLYRQRGRGQKNPKKLLFTGMLPRRFTNLSSITWVVKKNKKTNLTPGIEFKAIFSKEIQKKMSMTYMKNHKTLWKNSVGKKEQTL